MLGTVVDNELFEYALIKPLFRSDAPDSIKIVSGYATHAMAARHLIEGTSRKKNPVVDLIYGMAGSEGVSKINHLGFISLEQHKEFAYNDDKIFTCVRAQANGKGIETPQDNSEIGRYFRQRLGLPSGAYISVSDLKKYGRTEVKFYKLDEENYVMDFSKP